jgi:hypothetical protein
MDNTSFSRHNDAPVVSSHTLEHSAPLLSPDTMPLLKQGSKVSLPVGTLLSDVQTKELRWLWQRHLPLGKLTTLDGDGGLGKSMLALDLAARVSSGHAMPDGTAGLPGGAGVVLIVPDDGLADTIVPRLQRAGADLSRIVSIGSVLDTDARTGDPFQRPFRLPDDLDLLLEAIERVHAKLVLIDPLVSLVDPKQASRDPGLRMALAPLQMLIEDAEAACLIVGHQTKAGRRRPRAHEVRASLSIAASGLLVLTDPTDEHRRVLAHITSKLSPQADHLSFCIDSDVDAGGSHPSICWLGACSQSLPDLLNPPAPGGAMQRRGAVRQSILEALALFYPEALSITALAEILPEISTSNLRWTLKRMTDDGQIQQPARGTYCAFPPSLPSSEHQEHVSPVSQPTMAEKELSQQKHVSPASQRIMVEKELSHI